MKKLRFLTEQEIKLLKACKEFGINNEWELKLNIKKTMSFE